MTGLKSVAVALAVLLPHAALPLRVGLAAEAGSVALTPAAGVLAVGLARGGSVRNLDRLERRKRKPRRRREPVIIPVVVAAVFVMWLRSAG